MIVEEYLPEIKASMKLFYNNTLKKIDQANINELIRISKQGRLIYGYFKQVLEPNKYMITVMKHLAMFGAGSASTIAEASLSSKIRGMTLENYQNYLRKQANYLKILKIVEYEILKYTAPSPTTMYKKVGCSEEQFLDAIDEKYKKYEDYIRRAEKTIEYRHTKDATPAPIKKPKLSPGTTIINRTGYKHPIIQKQICIVCDDVLDEHNNLQCNNPRWKMVEV